MIITNLDWHIENERNKEHCGPYGRETNPNSRWYEPTQREEDYEYYLQLQYRAADVGYELFKIDEEYQITKDNKHVMFIETVDKAAEFLNTIDGKDTVAIEWWKSIGVNVVEENRGGK